MSDGGGDANGLLGGVTEAAHLGDERTALTGFLQRQRDLVAWKVRAATDETLRSVSAPSGLSLHGVVRHLENVERYWFREVFAGQSGLHYDWTDEDGDAEWRVPADVHGDRLGWVGREHVPPMDRSAGAAGPGRLGVAPVHRASARIGGARGPALTHRRGRHRTNEPVARCRARTSSATMRVC